ncbi:hypothetical protein GS491_26545 [Rhodococcus hoagii]|nr:hypothetical protein [Prescottella equi]NKS99573.1 hypothetical protein [Prescottella equi]
MVFEVRATHRVVSTGEAACEVHPDVFIDEGGRVFVNVEVVADACGAVAVRPAQEDGYVFGVGVEATELAVNWIRVLSGQRSAWMEMLESARRGEPTAVSAPHLLPHPDDLWAAQKGRERTVTFEVRATHRVKSGKGLACEIYPDVFVSKHRGGAVFSRLAGMAVQQPGDIVDALPGEEQDWFVVAGLENAVGWVTVSADFRRPSARSLRAARRASGS